MSRRRKARSSPSLFPFLSVLLCAMGVIIVVISGQNLIAVGGGLDQVLEIGAGTFEGKEPLYIECREDAIIIYPDGIEVPLDEVKAENPNSEWMQLLSSLESRKEEQYLVFLIRPEGTEAYEYCEYQANYVRGIDAGKDALLSGGDLILTENGKPVLSTGEF
jgi:hypothetical protein